MQNSQSFEIFLFDMDSVLLKPEGYHRALQETVRLAAFFSGYGNVRLTRDQINQFESLGISSEWHSSAVCMALLMLESDGSTNRNNPSLQVEAISPDQSEAMIDLDDFFKELKSHPIGIPARQRAIETIESLAKKRAVDPNPAVQAIHKSESIAESTTMNYFQELILGSRAFESTYNRRAQLQTESYLRLYDVPLLSRENAKKLLTSLEDSTYGAAIMTNRPSNSLIGSTGTPEAEMGAELVGLGTLPIIGYGELIWLASEIGGIAGQYSKPAYQHGLAAILSAAGWSVEESLIFAGRSVSEMQEADLEFLNGSSIKVFEDTPGGLIAVQRACELLSGLGFHVTANLIGIAEDVSKQEALLAYGAEVFPSVNQALASLDDF
jgi:phosphoglycolate phosphatase-like HAD superfamily hydrolase